MEGDVYTRAAVEAEQRYGRKPLFPWTLAAAAGAWAVVVLFTGLVEVPKLEATRATYVVIAIAGLLGFLAEQSRDRARKKLTRDLVKVYSWTRL